MAYLLAIVVFVVLKNENNCSFILFSRFLITKKPKNELKFRLEYPRLCRTIKSLYMQCNTVQKLRPEIDINRGASEV